MTAVIVFIAIAFALFVGGMINIALSPVIYETVVRDVQNSPEMIEAGYDETPFALYEIWRISPIVFFFAAAIYGFQAIRRRGSRFYA